MSITNCAISPLMKTNVSCPDVLLVGVTNTGILSTANLSLSWEMFDEGRSMKKSVCYKLLHKVRLQVLRRILNAKKCEGWPRPSGGCDLDLIDWLLSNEDVILLTVSWKQNPSVNFTWPWSAQHKQTLNHSNVVDSNCQLVRLLLFQIGFDKLVANGIVTDYRRFLSKKCTELL